MATANEQANEALRQEFERIKATGPELAAQGARLRAAVDGRRTESGFGKWSTDFWWLTVRSDALRRLALLVEQALVVVHSMSVLAMSRYAFEATLWLKLLERDRRYGFVYFWELMANQARYYGDLLNHLDLEVAFFREVDEKESRLHSDSLAVQLPAVKDRRLDAAAIASETRRISTEIDNEVARRFTLYAEPAKTNGYGFQAHLIETKVRPQTEQILRQIEDEQKQFEARIQPDMIRPNPPKTWRKFRWNWREQAGVVGRMSEYDFIYTYASKLLHALPVSITTNQPNLSADEMKMFASHTRVCLRDILDMEPE